MGFATHFFLWHLLTDLLLTYFSPTLDLLYLHDDGFCFQQDNDDDFWHLVTPTPAGDDD